jgi:3-dehydroquinate synthase
VFDPQNKQLADCYQRWGRALAVMDLNIYNLYGEQMQKYFDHHKLELKIHKTMIGEKAKSMDTLLSIVDSQRTRLGSCKWLILMSFVASLMLQQGGGLVTDVAG